MQAMHARAPWAAAPRACARPAAPALASASAAASATSRPRALFAAAAAPRAPAAAGGRRRPLPPPAAAVDPFAASTASPSSSAASGGGGGGAPAYATHTWTWRGHAINYATAGCGKPLLLVHGFGARAPARRPSSLLGREWGPA